MPTYAYKCSVCEHVQLELRTMRRRNKVGLCEACQSAAVRSIGDEQRDGRHTADLPDWISFNAGVAPTQVKEANRQYADLGVWFDRKGDAHVPGNVRDKFLKRRGLFDPHCIMNK